MTTTSIPRFARTGLALRGRHHVRGGSPNLRGVDLVSDLSVRSDRPAHRHTRPVEPYRPLTGRPLVLARVAVAAAAAAALLLVVDVATPDVELSTPVSAATSAPTGPR